MQDQAGEQPSLAQSIFSLKMLTCVFIGLSSGFPYYVLAQLVPAWLRTEAVDLPTIQ
jgi:PAT family beta-lactamase induction signal transducer AmpG